MDRSITPLLSELAKNLLVTSPQFEPYVPQSQQNTIRALQFLEALGILTHMSLHLKTQGQEGKASKAQTSSSTSSSLSSPESLSKKTTLSKDKQLLEALLKLRNTQTSLRRPPGTSSSIIRNPST
jgi:hypothetical protein